MEGYAVSGYPCDITDPAQVQALGQALSRRNGVRVLAQIAAVGAAVKDWRVMMAVDLLGPHLIADAVQPHMVPGAVALFVGSLAGYLPPRDARLDALLDAPLQPGFMDEVAARIGDDPKWIDTYAYAKLGMMRLAESRAISWAGKNMRAISVSPGMIDSPMARAQGAMLPSHDGAERDVPRNEKMEEIPLGREGTLPEVIAVLDFLASDAARFINGVDIVVDGGHRAVWRARNVITR
jgi:NAD(P)-dependent dehydrogenase (short-subunit alcohol dehydrogenase family)